MDNFSGSNLVRGGYMINMNARSRNNFNINNSESGVAANAVGVTEVRELDYAGGDNPQNSQRQHTGTKLLSKWNHCCTHDMGSGDAVNTNVIGVRETDSAAGNNEVKSNCNRFSEYYGTSLAYESGVNRDYENAACADEAKQQFKEPNREDAFSHLSYELSPLLEEMASSVQHTQRNYEGREFTAYQPQYENNRLYQRFTNTNSDKKSNLVQMDEGMIDKWVEAPEFQPAYVSETGRAKSYAEAVNPYLPRNRTKLEQGVQYCPYQHLCEFDVKVCPYVHGVLCPYCLVTVLDYEETEERQNHLKACMKEQETKRKVSLAIQKSKGLLCNICWENVKEKMSGEARFGILPNCNHCFCITCIRRWRQEARYSSHVTKSTFYRACPICRVESPFVCPSTFWVETAEEKEELLSDYKRALGVKPCRLYNYGQGVCPFGDKCFYLHSLPDGTRVQSPGFAQRPMRENAEGLAPSQDYVLWDYIAARNNPENDHPTNPSQDYYQYDSSQDSDTSN